MTRYSKLLRITFLTLVIATVLGLMTIFTAMYGPGIERYLNPVIKEFKVDSIKRENDKTLLMSGHMDKARGGCKLDSMAAYFEDVEPPNHKYLDLAKIEFQESGNEIIFRVAGVQTWGPWKISSDEPNNGDKLVITAYHRCHPLYLIPTKIVDLNVPR